MKIIYIIIAIVAVAAFAGGAWYFTSVNKRTDRDLSQTSSKVVNQESVTTTAPILPQWKEVGAAISGKFADADIVDLGNGTYRMYYSVEPEVSGNKLEMYSATSTDGATWKQEAGTRNTLKTFPDAVKLTDGSWRMYFQNSGVIKSAKSTDGLSWKDESGTRIDKTNSVGLTLDNVAAPTTARLADGSYVMVYRATINQKYSDKVPNQTTGVFLWATSADGLTWEKKGLAIDSRNATLEGWVDGPEWVTWEDGTQKLYFGGYKGVFESVFTNNVFSEPKLAYRGANVNEMAVYSPDPPGDPTIMKIGDTWNMYYGQHTKGIYRATISK